ncbi:MAG TPA: DUF202 domain-containing protein [Mycobacteriales bacterium]|nr:DUF202 domain-containing protein [Mycobacteriales bacterium]
MASEGRARLRDVGEEPDYRFSLANERTFLAWVRTALALLAAGVGVSQLLPDLGTRLGRHALGGALIGLALALAASAYPQWVRYERAMRLGQPLPRSVLTPVLGAGLTLVAATTLVYVLTSQH